MSNYTLNNLIKTTAVTNSRAIKIGDKIFVGFTDGGVDVSDTTATSLTVLNGYAFYNKNGQKTFGNISVKQALSYIPGTADLNISAGQYLGGAQTIKGDANLLPLNIKKGVTIFGVTGTYLLLAGYITLSDSTVIVHNITAQSSQTVDKIYIADTGMPLPQYN